MKVSAHLLLFVILAAMLNGCKKDEASIPKKDPLINWANPTDIKFGTPLSATQLNATTNITGTFVYTPAIGTKLEAGANQFLKVDFIPTDAKSYNVASKTVKINVPKDPVITWANPADIEVGTQLSDVQLNATADVAGIFVYTPAIGTKLNAGANQILKVDFTPTDAATYNTVSKTVKINLKAVTKKDPIITWANPKDISFGTKLSTTQLNATADVTGTFVYIPQIGALLSVGDNQVLKVDFTPADATQYNITSKTVKINVKAVTKKDPTITWANPIDINYGTKLSATQLNATADVAGTFVYTPLIGALLSVGDNQDLKVNFTPTDATQYNIASKAVKINVKAVTKKDPVITWAYPKDISYGTKLSATQLNATADVAGTFVYTPPIGTQLNVGANQVLKVVFTPTDGTRYNTTSKTVTINVIQATGNGINFNPNLTYGTMTDQEGNTYKTITIGSQTWMAENLRVTKYRNGNPIPNVINREDWYQTRSGAYCWSNHDITKRSTYGALYNWYAANDKRNIAPAGWHVPTDAEWATLIAYLGGPSVAGDILKEVGTSQWDSPNTSKDNASGFTALPGGYRNTDLNTFPDIRDSGYWWSATSKEDFPLGLVWARKMIHDFSGVERTVLKKSDGFSIRLIKD